MARPLVALLRAINVGGHTVTMERLRGLFEDIDLAGVSTVINSGNVVFDAPPRRRPDALERAIEAHLAGMLGYEVATFVRTARELAAAAAVDPFGARDGSFHVVFLKDAPAAAERKAVEDLGGARDELQVVGREVHWWTAGGLSSSDVKGDAIGKALGKVPTTARNRNTVQKLAAKLAG